MHKLYLKPLHYLKLFPVYLLQKPAGYDLRLYGLMPLIGLGTIIKRRCIEIEFWPFIVLFLFSTLMALCFEDWLSARRSFQTLCMAGFCSYLINYFSHDQLTQLAKNAIYLLVGYYIYDFSFGVASHVLILQTWHTYFLVPGLLNNPNYTGLLSAGLTIFFGISKSYRFFFIGLILVFISQSKTAFFCLLLAIPALFFFNKENTKLHFYAYGIFTLIALSPALLFLFEIVSPESLKMVVNTWSGSRYTIQLSFLELFKVAPFGVGYERSHEMVADYLMRGSSLLTSNNFTPFYVEKIGSHSTFIKVLCELGILGYICYLQFIYLILRKGLQVNPHIAVAFISICAPQMLLEGLNEFIFYFFIALTLQPSILMQSNRLQS